MKKIAEIFLLALALFLLFTPETRAESAARDIAADCKLSADADAKRRSVVLKEGYKSYWNGGEKGTLTVALPKGQYAQGVALSFFQDVPPIVIEAQDDSGARQIIAEYRDPYENAYISFPAPQRLFTIRMAEDSKVTLKISRLHVLSEGELPDWVQRWTPFEGDAELLVLSTHPDDELLWFGGLIPTYAGELKRKVMVAYMVGGLNAPRKNELLDGLWTCGVRCYPDIGYLEDGSQHPAWASDGRAQRRVVELLRKYRPRVVVTQDIEGEYGHPHHKFVVAAAIKGVTELAVDASFDPDSALQYGVHAVQKLYLHLWKEHKIVMNWDRPLDAFGGKTSLQVAREAYKKHLSQQRGKYRITTSGSLDSTRFGLYYSTVGYDEAGDDLFENCVAPNK